MGGREPGGCVCHRGRRRRNLLCSLAYEEKKWKGSSTKPERRDQVPVVRLGRSQERNKGKRMEIPLTPMRREKKRGAFSAFAGKRRKGKEVAIYTSALVTEGEKFRLMATGGRGVGEGESHPPCL